MAESDLETKLLHQSASSCLFPSSFDSLLFPVLPFIYEQSALIFPNPSFVTDFFCNFAVKYGKGCYLELGLNSYNIKRVYGEKKLEDDPRV